MGTLLHTGNPWIVWIVVLAATLTELGCASARSPLDSPMGTSARIAVDDESESRPTVFDASAESASETITTDLARENPIPFSSWAWPDNDRFQSAGRLRDQRRDVGRKHSEQAEVDRLRAHFDVVLPWLEAREDDSIERALQRLEMGTPHIWQSNDREDVAAELRLARRRQIARLEAYRLHGLFPKNQYRSARIEPIFVDSIGTACAVGHLMRLDGLGVEVEEIRRTQNGIFVSDAREGPLLAWVARSGLLVEEAAVIQPAYAPPPVGILGTESSSLNDLVSPNGSVNASGVTIDNCSMNRSVGSIPDLSPAKRSILDKRYPDLEYIEQLEAIGYVVDYAEAPFSDDELLDIRLISGQDSLYYSIDISRDDLFGSIDFPPSTTWVFWNAGEAGGFISDPVPTGPEANLEISFDVSPSESGFGIDATSFNVSGLFWAGSETYGKDLLIDIEIRTIAGDLLADWIIGEEESDYRDHIFDDHFDGRGAQNFSAQQRLSVSISANQTDLTAPLLFGAFIQTFHLVPVPEPGTAILLGTGLLLLSRRRHLY